MSSVLSADTLQTIQTTRKKIGFLKLQTHTLREERETQESLVKNKQPGGGGGDDDDDDDDDDEYKIGTSLGKKVNEMATRPGFDLWQGQ